MYTYTNKHIEIFLSVQSLSRVQLLATPWTVAHQAPPSMGFSRQEHWSGAPLPSPLSHVNSLWLHGLQHARLPCPSLPPGACSNLCPLSQWCHPTISSSVLPFSSCLKSFPVSGSFPMSWRLFVSGSQSIWASASSSVLPMNIQDEFPLGLTG